MLILSGEVRGVKKLSLPSGEKHLVIIESTGFSSYEVSLAPSHVQSGFVAQIESMRGKFVNIPIKSNLYKGRLYWNYDGDKLPVEMVSSIPVKKSA